MLNSIPKYTTQDEKDKWHKAGIKMSKNAGGSLLIGTILSLIVFKRPITRVGMTSFVTGLGIGNAWRNCNEIFKETNKTE